MHVCYVDHLLESSPSFQMAHLQIFLHCMSNHDFVQHFFLQLWDHFVLAWCIFYVSICDSGNLCNKVSYPLLRLHVGVINLLTIFINKRDSCQTLHFTRFNKLTVNCHKLIILFNLFMGISRLRFLIGYKLFPI